MERGKINLIKAIQMAARQGMEILTLIRAKVESVDEAEYTVKAVNTADEGEADAPVYTASLRAVVADENTGIIIIPAVGSIVTLGFVNNSAEQALVLACSRADKILIKGNTGVTIGDGSDPMVLGNQLKTWADSVDEAINQIITWGGTGIAPSGGAVDVGGIAPLSGVSAPQFGDSILSEKNKVD